MLIRFLKNPYSNNQVDLEEMGIKNKIDKVQNRDTFVLDWEKEIKLAVSFVSGWAVLILLIKLLNVDVDNLVILAPIFFVFIAGIFYTFFQIRIRNTQRQKETNIGGMIFVFGLIIILIPYILILFSSPFDFSSSYGNLYILGLILAGIGLYLEVTSLDEPFLSWVKVNTSKIRKILFTVLALFLFLILRMENPVLLIMPVVFLIVGWYDVLFLITTILYQKIVGFLGWVRHSWPVYFRNTLSWIKRTAINIYRTTIKTIRDALSWIKRTVINTYKAIVKAIRDTLSWIKRTVINTYKAIVKAIRDTLSWIKRTVINTYKAIVKAIRDTLSWIKRTTINIYNTTAKAIRDTLSWIKRTAINIYKAIVKAIRDTLSWIKRTAINIYKTVVKAIGDIGSWLKRTGISTYKYSIKTTRNTGSWFKHAIISTYKRIIKAIRDTGSWIKQTSINIFKAIVKAIFSLNA